MKVVITDAEYPDLDIERSILEPAGFTLELAHCRTPEDVIQAGRDAVAFLVQYASVTRQVFDALPNLRIVSRYGVGVDTIDLEAAREHGVWVANVPDYGTMEVATHAMGMILAMIRHLPFYDQLVKDKRWHYLATGPLHRPGTLTLGIVGVGRIGGTVARLAQPYFQHVLGCDPYLPEDAWPEGVEQVDLETLFQRSHVVSLHVPLTDETYHMVTRRLLEQMPRGGYLVNTARGSVVQLDDLLEALNSGQLAGAALDVLPQEPPPPDHPILSHPKVLLSPHAAFFSVEAEQELRRKAAYNIVAWAREGRPPYVVVEGRDAR
ncbi:MAG TPA: C-terminal binding protein [Caldilineae bacterium]|nr:C-terminal binding protein [Caldilineae bacterium]